MKVNLFLVRHGKTKENEEGRYIGRTDSGISDGGAEEIQRLKEKGVYPAEPDLVFSSPMKRCIQTARILYPDQNIIVLSELKEINFGIFEGKNYEELNGDKDYQKWINSGGKSTIPKGESVKVFTKRVMGGMSHIREYCSRFYEPRSKSVDVVVNAVLICHGGTIMAIRSILEKGDYFDYLSENGACHMVEL
ncbi:MAG: histidine phosphatase family protein [Eubacterium sp.]|nr:histidine phosphatase family protein [Eubacterium sp.]